MPDLNFYNLISNSTVDYPVSAINNLYAALGSPALPGWTASAGDPCAEAWQGVVCDDTKTNIISMYAFLSSLWCVNRLSFCHNSFISFTEMSLVLIWEVNWVIPSDHFLLSKACE